MSVSHHGASPPAGDDHQPSELLNELMKKFDQQVKGEKPREYPEGRIRGDDDGELIYKVGSDPEKGIVVVDFGKAVTWMGMSPQDAITLAQSLIKHARSIAKEPIVVELH